MNDHAVTALSPLDGRYAGKLATLRPLMSEFGYMHRRVQVEVTWFLALSQAGLAEFAPLSRTARAHLLSLVAGFSAEDALAIKAIEKTTNHDVKAVEYWIKDQFQAPSLDAATRAELERVSEFVHFARTSTTPVMRCNCSRRAIRCCCPVWTRSSTALCNWPIATLRCRC
jgi:adenylosuccinate lyase